KEGSFSRHSLYGSLGFDRGVPFLINREQAGKGGADVVMFVDDDDDGTYDAGEELIPAKAIKVDGMGKLQQRGNGFIRVSQLQNYFRYNLEVDRRQIDPNLVPKIDRFSFVVDPNQFKRIEIPFYRGGTITGTVYLEDKGARTPLSGTRVIIEQSPHGTSVDTVRTFADGGFYAMNIAPGSYMLTVDPAQRLFLHMIQKNGPLGVTVRRSQEGDIIDSLEIVLMKPGQETALKQEYGTRKIVPKPREAEAAEKAVVGRRQIPFERAVSITTPDADKDGVPDSLDKCPNLPEDIDGFDDGDGCPDYDESDIQKFISKLQESQTSVTAEEGGDIPVESAVVIKPPDRDRDRDGVPDSFDGCPDVPEDRDGFEDGDGCPDHDNDADRVPDAVDRCPNDPEDADGFEDGDGCPDYDNDADGVPDAVDMCRSEAGPAANNGCPETMQKSAKSKRGALILNPVMFDSGTALLTAVTCNVLDQVALSLLEWTDVRLEIQGHADRLETDLDLSLRRADMVRNYLVRKGVAAERMTATGYDSSRPVGSNRTAADRSKNRRVEFRRIDW
ncbi:MAG: OmpA family protein, partial [Chitinispirillaceae bacterium]|nr:OmpA family protein [Chitinispirillaceae bacterium]